jgi:hypothetical protein
VYPGCMHDHVRLLHVPWMHAETRVDMTGADMRFISYPVAFLRVSYTVLERHACHKPNTFDYLFLLIAKNSILLLIFKRISTPPI